MPIMPIMAARLLTRIPSIPSLRFASASRVLMRAVPLELPAQCQSVRVCVAALTTNLSMRSELPSFLPRFTTLRTRDLLDKEEETNARELPLLEYEDDWMKETLNSAKTIAMVGASSNSARPSFVVMKYLQGKGFRVVPINPGSAGRQILGEKCYASLMEMHADGVQAERIPAIADDAIEIGAKILWMQLGVRNAEAASTAAAAGLRVVQDRCPKIDIDRLYA